MINPKLNSHIPYYLSTLLASSLIIGTEFFHQPFVVLWIFFVCVPLIDQLLPLDNTNPTQSEEKLLMSQWKWKVPIYSYIFMGWVNLIWAFNYITRKDPGNLEFIVLTLSYSELSGIGFLFSHELCHKKNGFGKFVGLCDMLKSLYMHYYSEHIYGHHKYVSTPVDPATARYGQSLYSFYVQTIVGTFTKTCKREGDRMLKQNKSILSLNNRIIQWLIVEAVLIAVIHQALGNKCLLFFILQAFISVLLLETANYIRHYGLERKKLSNGEYEQVSVKHSWNAAQPVQNYMLLKLQRHSDHHSNAYKPYQILHSITDAPNLPCGYAVCTMASMIPTAWFSIINPLIDSIRIHGKPTEAQLKKSEKALKVWICVQVITMTLLWILILKASS